MHATRLKLLGNFLRLVTGTLHIRLHFVLRTNGFMISGHVLELMNLNQMPSVNVRYYKRMNELTIDSIAIIRHRTSSHRICDDKSLTLWTHVLRHELHFWYQIKSLTPRNSVVTEQ
jgi:hypothetical protein